jgi:hypothetical protein
MPPRVDINRIRDVDDDFAVELVAVAAEDIVDGRVPDSEHDYVAGERVADLTGAHVAGQLVRERLRLGALGPEQRDGMTSGKCAGRDAAGHVPGADDGDDHENGPPAALGDWLDDTLPRQRRASSPNCAPSHRCRAAAAEGGGNHRRHARYVFSYGA